MTTDLGAVESIVMLIAAHDSPDMRQCRAAVDRALGGRTDERDLLAYACAQLLAARTAAVDPRVSVALHPLEDRLQVALDEIRAFRDTAAMARARERRRIAGGAE